MATFNLRANFCPHYQVGQFGLRSDLRPKPGPEHLEIDLEAQVLPRPRVTIIKRIPRSIDQISKPNRELSLISLFLLVTCFLFFFSFTILRHGLELLRILHKFDAKLFNLIIEAGTRLEILVDHENTS